MARTKPVFDIFHGHIGKASRANRLTKPTFVLASPIFDTSLHGTDDDGGSEGTGQINQLGNESKSFGPYFWIFGC